MSETTESSEYSDRDETAIGALQRGEFAAAIAAATVALFVGVWVGVWAVPDAALAVPTTTEYGQTSAAYQPVPSHLPVVTVLGMAGGLYFAYNALTRAASAASDDESAPDEEETPATDGGTAVEQMATEERAKEADRLAERVQELTEENYELRNRAHGIAAKAYESGREDAREESEHE